MSTSGKRSGDDLSSQPKSQRNDNVEHTTIVTQAEVHNSSEDEMEPPIAYTTTNINDVFTANSVPSPQVAQTDVGDWAAPIILVITRTTRDNLMNFLTQVNIGSTQNTEQTSTSNKTTSTSNMTTTTSNTTTQDTCSFNTAKADNLERLYKEQIRSLNDIQRSFEETTLKEDCRNETELNLFRTVRKELTQFYVFGSKCVNMTKKIKEGQTDYLIRTNADFIPNRLPGHFIQELNKKLKGTTENVNAQMYNMTIDSCMKHLMTAEGLTRNTPRSILAKAWRTVKRSNKDNARTDFRTNRKRQIHDEQRETYIHTDRRPHTEYTQPRRNDRPSETQYNRYQDRTKRNRPTTDTRSQKGRYYDDRVAEDRHRGRYYNDQVPEDRYRQNRNRIPSYRTKTYYRQNQRKHDDSDLSDYTDEIFSRRNSNYHEEYPTIEETLDRRETRRHQNYYPRAETHRLN